MGGAEMLTRQNAVQYSLYCEGKDMNKIDFRSDTVTWPTPAMREAMAVAPVGDDVYGEDPTVAELEQLAATMLGKEAGLFVASGTMGNLVSLLTHTQRGDELILGEANHVYCWEAGGLAVLGGIVPKVLPMDELGRLPLKQVRQSIRPNDVHLPHSRLILLETTAGGRFGAPLPLDYMADVRQIADEHELQLHLDGARIFNAATALGVDVREISRYADSVSVCLSKGLCAPVGSVVVGSADFIARARRKRKLVGGGMRQAGIIAAAGIISLREMTQRLGEDHTHARLLAEGLAQLPHLLVNLTQVHSNMVFFQLDTSCPLVADEVIGRLRSEYNIWLGGDGPAQSNGFRALTHYWVGTQEIALFLEALHTILCKPSTP